MVVPRRVPCGPSFLTGGLGLAALVFLCPDEAVAGGLDAHPRRQRVDDADADAVQTARDLVAAAAELAARVEHGVDDLERVLAGRVLADRHAAAVVLDGHDAVGLDRDLDRLGVAGHRLVDRVVDDLPDEVVEAARVGRADVHARALADSLEALEDLDAGGVVVRGVPGALAATVRRVPAVSGRPGGFDALGRVASVTRVLRSGARRAARVLRRCSTRSRSGLLAATGPG